MSLGSLVSFKLFPVVYFVSSFGFKTGSNKHRL